jgi:hypothetical protein
MRRLSVMLLSASKFRGEELGTGAGPIVLSPEGAKRIGGKVRTFVTGVDRGRR